MNERDNLKDIIGPSIVDGELQYFSVSSITVASPRSSGCYRKWGYEKILKIRTKSENAEKAAAEGQVLHSSIDQYLTTGQNVLTPLALKGNHMIPPPGGGLLVETPIHVLGDKKPNGYYEIHSLLTVDGTPFVGFIDMLNFRGVNYGAGDIEDTQDPPGTVEICDWKRKSKAFDRHKNPLWVESNALIYEVQMAGYGEYVRQAYQTDDIRLSHGYFFEQGSAPRKSTKLHKASDFENAWKYGADVARTVKQIAREIDINKIPGNVRACEAFGGCAHRAYCEAYRNNSLDVLFSDKLVSDFNKETNMGLLTDSNVFSSAPPPSAASSAAELAQEEAALRAAQPVAQQMPGQTVGDAVVAIERAEQGYPQLSGAAAVAVAALRGIKLSAGAGLAGGGALSHVHLSEISHIFQLANDLEQRAGRPAPFFVPPPAPAPVAPPPAPTGWGVPVANPAAGSILAPGAPSSIPVLAAASAAPQTPAGEESAEVPAKKRGRPPKVAPVLSPAPAEQTAPPVAAPMASTLPPAAPQVYAPTVATAPAAAGAELSFQTEPGRALADVPLRVFVNARSLDNSRDLRDWFAELHAKICARYCVGPNGPTIQDVRAAPKDGPLGFSGWKGATRDIVSAEAEKLEGNWHLDTRGDDLMEVVAEGMRITCNKKGALYVRGLGY